MPPAPPRPRTTAGARARRSCTRPRTRGPGAGPRGSGPGLIATCVPGKNTRRASPATTRARVYGSAERRASRATPVATATSRTNSSTGSSPSTVDSVIAMSVADAGRACGRLPCPNDSGGSDGSGIARPAGARRRRRLRDRRWDRTALAVEGARVALIGRTRERVEAAAAELAASRSIADLATATGPADAVTQAVAGARAVSTCSSSTPGARRRAPSTPCPRRTGTRRSTGRSGPCCACVRAALPHLRAGREPAILVVLSSSVREPIPALTTSNVLRPGLAGLDQDADGRDRPDPDQRPRARPDRHGPDPVPRRQARRGGRDHAR